MMKKVIYGSIIASFNLKIFYLEHPAYSESDHAQ